LAFIVFLRRRVSRKLSTITAAIIANVSRLAANLTVGTFIVVPMSRMKATGMK